MLLYQKNSMTRYIYNLQMRQLLYSRKEGQNKKQYYRRIALIKKNQWASTHKVLNQSQFKSHFMSEEEDILSHDSKTRKIQKQSKPQQRLRNRMAAQDSRERHRSYVVELQRKARLYDELIAKQHHLLCKKCQHPIQLQPQDSEAYISSDCSGPVGSNQLVQQIILHEYLDQQMIRIDNQGTTSPFAIFFIICMVAVIAVFTFGGNGGSASPRLLTNYHSTINKNTNGIDHNYGQIQQDRVLPGFLKIVQADQKEEASCPNQQVDTDTYKQTQNLRKYTSPVKEKKWQKIGNYVCSEPETEFALTSKTKQNPQFFIVRTKKTILLSQSKSGLSSKNQQILEERKDVEQWQDISVSSCFLESA